MYTTTKGKSFSLILGMISIVLVKLLIVLILWKIHINETLPFNPLESVYQKTTPIVTPLIELFSSNQIGNQTEVFSIGPFCKEDPNGLKNQEIHNNMFKKLNIFEDTNLWIQSIDLFIDYTLMEFRTYWTLLLRKSKTIQKPYPRFLETSEEQLIQPLEHGNNTCFLVALFLNIKNLPPLLCFLLLKTKKNGYWLPIFKRTMNLKKEHIPLEDVKVLLECDKSYQRVGMQSDPRDTLDKFFSELTDPSMLQFYVTNNVSKICEKGCMRGLEETGLVMNKHYPLIEIFIASDGDKIFNLQEMLFGKKIDGMYCNNCKKVSHSTSNVYKIPLILNAPPFLVFHINYYFSNFDYFKISNEKRDVTVIIQDTIEVLTVLEQKVNYEITGYTLCKLLSKEMSHYVAVIKVHGEWYEYDGLSVCKKALTFPLSINSLNKTLITQVFYKRVLKNNTRAKK
ncbi:hypothetical protein CDIK_1079 [Cucumispora dikerogammari]|nr:hypothetical protein CDIK_1079 [Cucumispora dikerogammari]